MLVNLVLHVDYSNGYRKNYMYFWNEEDNYLCANTKTLKGRNRIIFRDLVKNPYILSEKEVTPYEAFLYEAKYDASTHIIATEIHIDEALNYARTYCVLHNLPIER